MTRPLHGSHHARPSSCRARSARRSAGIPSCARAANGEDPVTAILRQRQAAAVPVWQQRLQAVGDYLKARQGWLTLVLTVLFPKVLVAILCRTIKAVTTQISLELGGWGLETFTSIANITAGPAPRLLTIPGQRPAC